MKCALDLCTLTQLGARTAFLMLLHRTRIARHAHTPRVAHHGRAHAASHSPAILEGSASMTECALTVAAPASFAARGDWNIVRGVYSPDG